MAPFSLTSRKRLTYTHAMPKRENSPPQGAETEQIVVRLKPFLGIRPGTYLTVLYVIAILLVIFFALFFPGLRSRGSYLVFRGDPDRATVFIDGKFAGSTPCTVFAAKGSRSIEIVKPFYGDRVMTFMAPGRVFATLLVPQRTDVAYHLELDDASGLFDWALDDFARNPIIPEIITKTVSEVLASFGGVPPEEIFQKLADFIENAMYFVTNEQGIREVVNAEALIATKLGFLSPSSAVGFIDKMMLFQAKYDNFASWLILSSSKESSNRILSTTWSSSYAARYFEHVSRMPRETSPAASGGLVRVHGVTLRPIPAGRLLMGRDDVESTLGKTIDLLLAHPVRVSGFYIAETEVTNRQYKIFVDAMPEWKPSNREALTSTGLVSEGYLESWSGDSYPAGSDELPVTGVSWHAASAFCSWLEAGLAASRPGATVRLPTEAEWEWAARGGLRGSPYPSGDKPGRSVFFVDGASGPGPAGSSEPNGYGLRDMAGNVWEWCADSFAPAAYLLSSFDAAVNHALAAALPVTSEKVVRGGAWNNPKELLRVYTRGSQPADWCTSQLGFRPAATIP